MRTLRAAKTSVLRTLRCNPYEHGAEAVESVVLRCAHREEPSGPACGSRENQRPRRRQGVQTTRMSSLDGQTARGWLSLLAVFMLRFNGGQYTSIEQRIRRHSMDQR